MAEYEKVTFESFKEKLGAGGYSGLVGVRRAVGRMHHWTKAEREKALSMAEKVFGTDGAKPAKKAVKKAKAAAKGAKKTAKKAAKKTAKLGRRPGRPAAAMQGDVLLPAMEETEDSAIIRRTNERIDSIHRGLAAMQQTKALGALETEVAKGATRSQQALTRIVEELCHATGLSIEEQKGTDFERSTKATRAQAQAQLVEGPNSEEAPLVTGT